MFGAQSVTVCTRSVTVGLPGEVTTGPACLPGPCWDPTETPLPSSRGPPHGGLFIPSAKGHPLNTDVGTWCDSQMEAESPSLTSPLPGDAPAPSPGGCGSQQQLCLHMKLPRPHPSPQRCRAGAQRCAVCPVPTPQPLLPILPRRTPTAQPSISEAPGSGLTFCPTSVV